MKKIYLLFGVVIIILIGLGVASEGSTSSRTDWTPSFSKSSKRPYGSYILYERLKDLFPESKVIYTKKAIYNYLNEDYFPVSNPDGLSTDSTSVTYLFFNEYFEVSDLDLEELQRFVKQGNHVMIMAYRFSQNIHNSLGFTTTFGNLDLTDSVRLKANYFQSEGSKEGNPYYFTNSMLSVYFDSVNTSKTLILGVNQENKPVFIQRNYGKGSFYVCTHPTIFTNYMMMHPKYDYKDFVSVFFSHLSPDEKIVWDEYHKPENLDRIAKGQSEILRYIYSQPPLYWALILMVVSVLIYVIFEMKRRQRIIPVITPLRNSTLDFTETIGRLYFQRQAHKNIAEKRIRFFLEYLRNHFYIQTHELNDEFCEIVAGKTNVEIGEVKTLIKWVHAIKSSHTLSENDLISFSALLDGFYAKAPAKGI
ncbi:MAG: DUF4350 domain-containing protein [Bacteroidia bacterium]|nr:DUF4350 domain-containing protein [Bacteroidia bacterium]